MIVDNKLFLSINIRKRYDDKKIYSLYCQALALLFGHLYTIKYLEHFLEEILK
jgi:hypothetical protein